MERQIKLRVATAAAIFGLSGSAMAQSSGFDCTNLGHFDLYFEVDPPASDGGRVLVVEDGDGNGDPDFPVEGGTGITVIPADFGDFPGGPHITDDPGWVVRAGNLLPGEFLWMRALGSLRFWDKDDQRWLDQPPAGERVRYFGAIPPDVLLFGTEEEKDFYREGTIWTANGVLGPLESPIEAAADVAVGDMIHAHFDFCVEAQDGDCIQGIGFTGSPSIGAYLIEVQVWSDELAANGSQQKYIDSPPIKVVLNNGLVDGECEAAIGALVVPETIVDDSPALPASGVLIMTGP